MDKGRQKTSRRAVALLTRRLLLPRRRTPRTAATRVGRAARPSWRRCRSCEMSCARSSRGRPGAPLSTPAAARRAACSATSGSPLCSRPRPPRLCGPRCNSARSFTSRRPRPSCARAARWVGSYRTGAARRGPWRRTARRCCTGARRRWTRRSSSSTSTSERSLSSSATGWSGASPCAPLAPPPPPPFPHRRPPWNTHVRAELSRRCASRRSATRSRAAYDRTA